MGQSNAPRWLTFRARADAASGPSTTSMIHDDAGAVIGMVLVNVRFLLERDGTLTVTVTLPPDHVVAAKIQPAPVAA
jgi:hypothetical protein